MKLGPVSGGHGQSASAASISWAEPQTLHSCDVLTVFLNPETPSHPVRTHSAGWGRSGTEHVPSMLHLVLYPSDPYQLSYPGPHQRKDFPGRHPLSLPRPLPTSAQIARAAKPYETSNHSFRLLKTRSGVVCPQRVNKKQERAMSAL